jgi:hypothetical protein
MAYIGRMTHRFSLAAVLCAVLAAGTPALAEEPAGDIAEGTDLMQEGAKLLLRGFMAEMGPALSQMEELARLMGEWDQYYPPEVLPNGDIILRRRVPLVPGLPGSGPQEDGAEIDL